MSLLLFALLILAPDPALFALWKNADAPTTVRWQRYAGLLAGAIIQIAFVTIFALVLEAYYPGFAIFITFLFAMFLFNRAWRLLNGSKVLATKIPLSFGGALVWRLQHIALMGALWLVIPFRFEGRVNPHDIVFYAQSALVVVAVTWLVAALWPSPLRNDEAFTRSVRIAHMLSIVVLLVVIIKSIV